MTGRNMTGHRKDPRKPAPPNEPVDVVISRDALEPLLSGQVATAIGRLGCAQHPVRIRLAGVTPEAIYVMLGSKLHGKSIVFRDGARGTPALKPDDPGIE